MKAAFLFFFGVKNGMTSFDMCPAAFGLRFIHGKAAFLSKRNSRVISSHMQQAEEYCICVLLTCISVPSACDGVIGAGLVLTGSWWGVMRDANSHNLSLEADQLVTSKFIQRVLSLHLPYFEVALFHLRVSVRDRVFIPSSTTVCNGQARNSW